jgi:hypothetical protein
VTSTPTLNGQELELFRIGNYGAKGSYTPADMEGIVARYSAAGESPIAIGHPKTDREPAFGWMKSLRFDGTVLHGVPGDVHPVLDAGWQQKMYRNRSVAFAKDPQGKLYIHHVAMLGAVPPVVQGLRDAQFSSDPYEAITFSDSGEDMADQDVKKTVLETLKEFFSSKDSPTHNSPAVDVDAITKKVTEAVEAKFSADLAKETEARKAVETAFEDHKKTFSASDNKTRVDGAIAALKTAGAWVPAYDKIGVPELFSALAAHSDIVTFSDAGGKEVKQGLLETFSATLKAVGKIVPEGQRTPAGTTETSAALPESNGGVVDPASATFSAMVDAYAIEHKVTYNEAYKQLNSQGKRPTSGSSAAGAV